MMIRSFSYALITLFLGSSLLVFAATDDFTVRTMVGDDSTPPTVPTGLTATPIASSQINLTWNPSTDDYELSGYQVFRDDVQIATTTTTNYSDVGLMASTTYTYFVTAFDSLGNVSASSTPTATTTLASSTPPTSDTQKQQGTRIRVELVRFEILPGKDSVLIRYETKSNVRSIIRWGKTISYELGSLAERSYSRFHETRITGLTPGTTYKFDIFGEHSLGITGILIQDTFTTLPLEDVFPPGNVMNVRGLVDGPDIILTWDNPADADFDKVRILRSDRFYPSDRADGWVVYEGDGEFVRDAGVARKGTCQYYTVFASDELGNISSGTVVRVCLRGDGIIVAPTTTPPDTTNTIELNLSDLTFIQEGVPIEPEDGVISIDGGKHLTILLPYERVSEHLKTIVVTLDSPTKENESFMFLLRINRDKTAYTAILAPLGIDGVFPFRVSVFDHETAQIGYAEGNLLSRILRFESTTQRDDSFLHWFISLLTKTSGYLLWFILLLILLGLWARRLIHTNTRTMTEGKESR